MTEDELQATPAKLSGAVPTGTGAAAERLSAIRLIARRDGAITQCEHPCAKGDGVCITSVGAKGAAPSWTVTGSLEAVTLTPSVNCLKCGWHGHIREGQMVDPTPEAWRAAQGQGQ